MTGARRLVSIVVDNVAECSRLIANTPKPQVGPTSCAGNCTHEPRLDEGVSGHFCIHRLRPEMRPLRHFDVSPDASLGGSRTGCMTRYGTPQGRRTLGFAFALRRAR
jgi:hypothetical protein